MFSRTRVVVLATALLLPLIALGIWHALVPQNDKHDQIDQILDELGYFVLVPPSRLFGPGTINTVEKLPNGSLKLHAACTMDKKALAALWEESTTVERSFAQRVKNTFIASAKAGKMATSGAAGKQTNQISASLQDMRVITMSHENLIKVRGQYLKGTCEEAVLWNLRSGADVCQTEEVLQADITYRMHFVDGLESTETAALSEQIAASFGLTVDESRGDVIRGEDLYYGVKLRLTSCFRLKDNHQPIAIGNPTGSLDS